VHLSVKYSSQNEWGQRSGRADEIGILGSGEAHSQQSMCGFGHHDLLTGLGRQFGKLAFGSIEGTARFDERDHGSAATG
jgi:hypothetical protein